MSEIQNRDQKVQQNSDRAARIREFRAETIARRPLPPIVMSRTITVNGRSITQHLVDLWPKLGAIR